MDIKVENKDIVMKDNGVPVMINGIEQAVQQLKLAAEVTKGAFIYDREMGMEIPEDIYGKVNMNKTIETILNELLIDLPRVFVTVQSVSFESDKKTAMVTVSDGYNTLETEVILHENL